MNQRDIEKLENIISDRKRAHKYLMAKESKVYEAFLSMEKAAYSAGALERKYKEFIAIGISIAINCESCLEWHIRQALESGATHEQVIEAIEVGIEMGGGPATVSSRFALKVLEYYTKESKTSKSARNQRSD
jgi:AhpD family alkylhydroperoxidase